MSEHRALGSTGRARRVNERSHIRVFPLRFRGNAFRCGDALRFFDKRRHQKQRRRRVQFFVRDQQHQARVFGDIVHFRFGQHAVDRNDNRAQTDDREVNVNKCRAVLFIQTDTIASLHALFVQDGAIPRDVFFQLAIRDIFGTSNGDTLRIMTGDQFIQ